jgi:ABC-type oligopeptide transport system substrate-binding subunit
MTKPVAVTKIDYIFVPGQPFSLALEDSDYTQNQVLLDPIVGTLVKYGPTGKAEPYLAVSWSTNPENTSYKFILRKGLTCSDGHALTPQNYADGLLRLLKKYAQKKGAALEFQKLKGWSKIATAQTPQEIGIQGDDEKSELTFTFARPPHGLMNLLRMPYFGFYSPANFDSKTQTIDKFKVISCGPYELKNASESSITLVKRNEWFTSQSTTVNEIQFRREATLPTQRPDHPTIVDSSLVSRVPTPDGYRKVFGTPVILLGMVLSPHLSAFESLENRQWMAEQIKQHRPQFVEGIEAMTPSDSFMEYPPKKQSAPKAVDWKTKTVSAYITPNVADEFRSRIQNTLKSILATQGLSVTFPDLDLNDHKIADALFDNRLVDIRVNGVSIGTYFHPSAYRMMFCSNMGVAFPDPNGAVCSLIDQFDKSEDKDLELYGRKINDQIEHDAATIPLARQSLGWLYSDQFDPTSIMPIPNYPRFELLKFR